MNEMNKIAFDSRSSRAEPISMHVI